MVGTVPNCTCSSFYRVCLWLTIHDGGRTFVPTDPTQRNGNHHARHMQGMGSPDQKVFEPPEKNARLPCLPQAQRSLHGRGGGGLEVVDRGLQVPSAAYVYINQGAAKSVLRHGNSSSKAGLVWVGGVYFMCLLGITFESSARSQITLSLQCSLSRINNGKSFACNKHKERAAALQLLCLQHSVMPGAVPSYPL